MRRSRLAGAAPNPMPPADAPAPARLWPFPPFITLRDPKSGEPLPQPAPAQPATPAAGDARLLPGHSDADVADLLGAELARLDTRIDLMQTRNLKGVQISLGFARSLQLALTAAAQRLESKT